MQVINITHQGKDIKIEFATEPSEITLRQWVDAILCLQDAPENVQQFLKGDSESVSSWDLVDWSVYYTTLAEFVSIFCKGEHDVISLIPKGSLIDNTAQDGIGALFGLLIQAVTDYKPQAREQFKHKGDIYKLPIRVLDAVGNVHHAPDVTTIEAVEALQIEHVYSAKDDNKQFVIKDRRYHTDLGIAACICRKVLEDGTLERMPLDMNKRRFWVKKKMKDLEDLPMSVGLDISFFLINSKRNLLNILSRAGRLRIQHAILKMQKDLQRQKRGVRRLDGTVPYGK